MFQQGFTDGKFIVSCQYYLEHVEGRDELYNDRADQEEGTLNPAESILEMREYCFHFEANNENIRPVSLRYILPTPSACITLKQSMKNLLILPWIDERNFFKGTALAIRKKVQSGSDMDSSILMMD